MTEVREEHREMVRADLMKRMPKEEISAEQVAKIKREISVRAQKANLLKGGGDLGRQTKEKIEFADLKQTTPETIELRGTTPVDFTLSNRGKDGSVAEERRTAFVREMQGNTPIWVTGKDGAPLSFSTALLEASPISKYYEDGVRRLYPVINQSGAIESVMRVTLPNK